MVFIEPKTDLCKPDNPRPLTPEERKKIRDDKFGGDASVEQLTQLARQFAKLDREKAPVEKSSGSNNGWDTRPAWMSRRLEETESALNNGMAR